MSTSQPTIQIEYPESDGKPMGETDVHRDWMFRILQWLQYRYRDQRVYVSSDLLVYYQQGQPARYVVPDDFVVLDCESRQRRTFKIWEEGRVPDLVFEVTSSGTRREDEVFKPRIYASIGVHEMFLYDPTGEYLRPPLQGFRLDAEGDYARIEADNSGALTCERLGLLFRLEGSRLTMYNRQTGEPLQTEAEAERAAREAAEEELQRLREQLKQNKRQPLE